MFIFVILIAFAVLRLLAGVRGSCSNISGMCLTNSAITLSGTCIIRAPISIRVRYFDFEKFTAVIP